MVLVPPASIMISFLIVKLIDYTKKTKNDAFKVVIIGFTGLILFSAICSGYIFYKSVNA